MIKAAAGSARRSIPEDFRYNPKKLKHLKRILHNVSIALGTVSSASSEFSRMKSPEVSPDGLLGGVGYIIPIKDIKQSLVNAAHELSNIADCIADELTNPRWEAEGDSEVKELIKEKEKAEEQVEEEIPDIEPDDVVTPAVTEEPGTEHKDDNNADGDPVRFKEAKVRDVLGTAIRHRLKTEK